MARGFHTELAESLPVEHVPGMHKMHWMHNSERRLDVADLASSLDVQGGEVGHEAPSTHRGRILLEDPTLRLVVDVVCDGVISAAAVLGLAAATYELVSETNDVALGEVVDVLVVEPSLFVPLMQNLKVLCHRRDRLDPSFRRKTRRIPGWVRQD
jgi:hypothetical protein